MIATKQPGETVQLDLFRYGDRRRVAVRLMEAPTAGQEAGARPAPGPTVESETSTQLGVGVSVLTPELARKYELPAGATGLVITDVANYSAAARYGISEGTRIQAVDGQEVSDVAGFRRAVERKGPGDIISLRLVYPEGENGIVNVRLPE